MLAHVKKIAELPRVMSDVLIVARYMSNFFTLAVVSILFCEIKQVDATLV